MRACSDQIHLSRPTPTHHSAFQTQVDYFFNTLFSFYNWLFLGNNTQYYLLEVIFMYIYTTYYKLP